MDAFVQRKKRKLSPAPPLQPPSPPSCKEEDGDQPTDFKLALLSSLYPSIDQDALLDVLLAHDGCVAAASAALAVQRRASPTKSSGRAATGYQSSLRRFAIPLPNENPSSEGQASGSRMTASPSTSPSKDGTKKRARPLSRKGATLHLYDPVDVAEHTPCTIVHNFLPKADADALLREMLDESVSFEKITFRLFENVVSSPHTSSFYVESFDEMRTQKTDYIYNGARLTDVRRITPQLLKVKPLVQEAVNAAIQERIQMYYPGGRKLAHQSPDPWEPNAAFVNCYAGARESVGWHSDQLTYLGPRAIIGSLSLGVAREFRVRRIVPRDVDEAEGLRVAETGVQDYDDGDGNDDDDDDEIQAGTADPQNTEENEGQISIHLPHNSLLVMHAEMQEQWKHCVVPAPALDPHPIAGTRRINITYRHYKAVMHPSLTPRCHCAIPCVLRVVQRRRRNRGRYFWMCHGGAVPGRKNCAFFQWAEFDDDGNPVWAKQMTTAPPDASISSTRPTLGASVKEPRDEQMQAAESDDALPSPKERIQNP